MPFVKEINFTCTSNSLILIINARSAPSAIWCGFSPAPAAAAVSPGGAASASSSFAAQSPLTVAESPPAILPLDL